MLRNTYHKLILFCHIHFHVSFSTSTQHNLKINAVSVTSQICCTLQRKSRLSGKMDDKNISEQKLKKNHHKIHRYPRSTSIPSGSNYYWNHVVGPQRTQSQIVLNGYVENNMTPMYSYMGNQFIPGLSNEFVSVQQPWCHYQQSVPQLMFQSNEFCSVNNSNSDSVLNISRRKRKVLNRKWEPLKNIDKKNKKFMFTLMSYNILAQDLVDNHNYLYKNHDKKTLQWDVRWINILKEIGDADPDIICFQEVQETHIEGYFDVLEKNLGYKSLYKKRTGIRTDGCAIYYKSKKLILLESEKIEYFQENVPVLNRDNVGIVAKFVPKEGSTQSFIVATTHLLYNPKRQDVRLAQIQNLIAEIDKMAFMDINQDGTSSYLPIILTGDLNSTPDSAVYEFITRGLLKYENLSKRSLMKDFSNEINGKMLIPESLQLTDNCQFADLVKKRYELSEIRKGDGKELCHKNVKFSSGTLSHPFKFKSVYRHNSNGDFEGTTFQDEWITVDYIFYSGRRRKGFIEDKLKLLSRCQLFTKEELGNIMIPNWKLGSDHFSLIAKFSLE